MASELQSVLNEIKLEKDSKLLPENIRKGVNVLGVEGSIEGGVDTSDATATSDDIINPKTAYINGEKVIGNIVPTYMYDPTAIVSDTRTTDLTNTGNYPMGVTYDRDIIVDYDGTNIRVYKLNTATNSYDKVHSYTRADLGISDSIIKQIKITKTEVVEGFYRIGFMVLTSISDGAATQTIVTNFLKKSTGELNVIPTGYSKLNTSAQRISWGSGGFAFAENNPNYVSTICREHYGDSQGWSRLYTYYLGTDTVTLHNSKTDNGIPRWEHIIDIEYCGNDNYIRTTSSLASGNGNLLIAVSDYKYLFTRSGRIAVNKNGDKCIIPSGENTILYSMVNNGSSITLSELHTFNVTLNGNYYWGDNDIIYNAVNTNTLKIFNLDTINGNMTLQGTFTANLNVVGLSGTPTFYDFNVKGFTCKSTGGLISLYSYKYNTEGTLVGLTKNGVIYKDTSDATATANSIAEGKIAYANGEKIVGTIKEIGGSIYSADTVWVDNDLNTLMMQDDSRSYDAVIRSNGVLGIGANLDVVAEVIDLTPDKIIDGNTILGVEGTGASNYFNMSVTNETIYNFLKAIPLIDTSAVTDMSGMFAGFTGLTTIPLLNTSNVTIMESMFESCENLVSIPQIDMSKVTSTNSMFMYCFKLTDLPELNTTLTTDMSRMFQSCESLVEAPMMDTSSIQKMMHTFRDCISLKTVPQYNLITLQNTTYMFSGCTALTEIPAFNTPALYQINFMFNGCENLVTIPQMDFSQVQAAQNAFKGCTSLSEESLNNILAMMTQSIITDTYKTLAYIGLTEEQATLCTTLSNWVACEAAGWTTGH